MQCAEDKVSAALQETCRAYNCSDQIHRLGRGPIQLVPWEPDEVSWQLLQPRKVKKNDRVHVYVRVTWRQTSGRSLVQS